jgi:WD40 repeat protein
MAIVTQQTETNRIQQHLQAVEQQLRAKQPVLPPDQLEERARNLDRLHEYWVQGEFPRNYTHPQQQSPCFIDPDGRSCAVARLLLATGNDALAHQIAAVANHALLPEMSFPQLNTWVAQSGLTLDELSLIQPAYSYCSYIPEATGHQKPPAMRVVNPAQPLSVTAQGGVVAIAPSSSFTSLPLPTFLVYVHGKLEQRRGKTPVGAGEPITTAEFTLRRRGFPSTQGNQHVSNAGYLYSATITLPDRPAMICLSLPALDSTQGLECGVDYCWQFDLQPTQWASDEKRDVSALVQRVSLTPVLQHQLEQAMPLQQAILYAKHGLWCNAVTIMAEQLSAYPDDPSLRSVWQQILQAVGLESFAAVPLVHCPALIHYPCKATVSLEGHQQRVYSANFSSDGQCIVTASEDSTVRLWSLAGTPLRVIQHQQAVSSASFSPDGQLILTTSQHGTVQVWNLAGQQVAKVKHLREDNTIRSAQFSPDGRYVVSTSSAETKVWHLSGELLFKLDPHYHWKIREVNFSADSRSLVAFTASSAYVWDLSGNLIAEFRSSQNQILSVAGEYLFTNVKGQMAQVWTLLGERVTELKGHFSTESSAKLSPDGKYIVTTSSNCAAQVWNFSGALMAELKGNFPAAYLASFSPDGKSIVTASGDRVVRIWSLTGALLNTFGHPTRIMSTDFSPDGQHLMTVCEDPIVRLWSIR